MQITIILDRKGPDVWSVTPETMVYDAISLMAEKNVGALPVIDGTRLVGMISERDYTRKVVLVGKSSKETPVSDIMTAFPVTASRTDTIEGCMRLMTEKRVRHLPVMDGGKMIGLISMGDLVNCTIKTQTATILQLEKYITGEYPG